MDLNCSHPTEQVVQARRLRGQFCAVCEQCEQLLATENKGELWIVRDPSLTNEAKTKIEDDFIAYMTSGAN